MRSYSFFLTGMLAMGLSLVACNKEQNAVVEQPEADQIPVDFGAYVNRPTTKAGLIDANLETSDIQINDDITEGKGSVGFGVFAYYTNADNYDQTFIPNFMYNQKMVYKNATSGWQYTPIKYWPNEFGSGAYSDDSDKISFFAYAPYVTVNPASGKVKVPDGIHHDDDNGDANYGIVGMKRNNATGDPMIQYKVTAYADKQVDLVWGTATNDSWALKNGGNQTGITAGKPLLNIQHPQATSSSWTNAQKVTFDFKHALAKINVTVDTKVNSAVSVGNPAAGTKVFVRSVTFEGFDTKGALNLNNAQKDTALWYNFDFSNELNNGGEFTIYDGRKDGKEGLTAATKEYAAINRKLIQNKNFDAAENGVTQTPTNLFRNTPVVNDIDVYPADTDPILVIPNGDKLKVTIEYDVLTKDDRLAGILNDGVTQGSVVKNVITRYITKGDAAQGSVSEPSNTDAIKLENGKQYTIKLHLGLNSVEFDASVSPWLPGSNGGADLPHNN